RHTSDEGCSLIALERQVLGAGRIGDVPGVEIPGRYFHFVRRGDAQPLAAVLEHNRLDLLSLAGLTARIFHLVEAGPGQVSSVGEGFALARVYERDGPLDRAEAAFEHTVADGVSSRVSDPLMRVDA